MKKKKEPSQQASVDEEGGEKESVEPDGVKECVRRGGARDWKICVRRKPEYFKGTDNPGPLLWTDPSAKIEGLGHIRTRKQ